MSLPLHVLRPAAQGFAVGLLVSVADGGVSSPPEVAAPQPSVYDIAPAPRASAPAVALSAPAPMADFAAPSQSESINAEMADEAKVSKRAMAPAKTLDEQLYEVLHLQNAGQKEAAEVLLKTLHKHFPDENLTARLKELKKD